MKMMPSRDKDAPGAAWRSGVHASKGNESDGSAGSAGASGGSGHSGDEGGYEKRGWAGGVGWKGEDEMARLAQAFFEATTKESIDNEDILPQEDSDEVQLSVFNIFSTLFPEAVGGEGVGGAPPPLPEATLSARLRLVLLSCEDPLTSSAGL